MILALAFIVAALALLLAGVTLWIAWDNRKAAWATERLVRLHSQDTDELPPLGKVRLGERPAETVNGYLDALRKREAGRRNH